MRKVCVMEEVVTDGEYLGGESETGELFRKQIMINVILLLPG